MRGVSEEIDAYAAAHTALAGADTLTAKTGTGVVEQIRLILTARHSALKSRSEVTVQIQSLLVTAPEPLRQEYWDLTPGRLVTRLAASRTRTGEDPITARTRQVLKTMARRYQYLAEEGTQYEVALEVLVTATNPALMQTKGIWTLTAAQLLITAGDNVPRQVVGRFSLISKLGMVGSEFVKVWIAPSPAVS